MFVDGLRSLNYIEAIYLVQHCLYPNCERRGGSRSALAHPQDILEVEFLGRTVNRGGLGIGQSYIDTMDNWSIPLCTKDVERFCGFANYHRNFIKDFAEMIALLYAVRGKNRFNWGDEQQSAFNKVKLALTGAPVLTLPTKEGHFILDTEEGHFILDTDASEFALGAELLQIQDGQERTISYAVSLFFLNKSDIAPPCAVYLFDETACVVPIPVLIIHTRILGALGR